MTTAAAPPQTGKRCGAWAIPGGTVCKWHGGNAPNAKKAAATVGPELTVGIERAGAAAPDLSGFDITSRNAVLTIEGRKYLMTSGTARALAGALMEAACIIDREESQ